MSNIFVVGDSQSVNPGQVATRKLRLAGHSTQRISNVGMGPYDYVRLESLWNSYVRGVSSFKPNLIVLIFGSNDAPDKNLGPALLKLKNRVAPKVILSGPPQYPDPKHQEKGAQIREVYQSIFGVDYFDSYPYTSTSLARAGDGLHFTVKGSTPWGEAIADEVIRRLSLR